MREDFETWGGTRGDGGTVLIEGFGGHVFNEEWGG